VWLRPGLALLLVSACQSAPNGRTLPPSMLPSPAPSPASPTPAPNPARAELRLVQVATLQEPLAMAVRPDDPSLFVAQKTGQVVAIRNGRPVAQPVLDLSGEVSLGGEQGLLGLTFSPDGAFLYVNYTDLSGHTHVDEFAVDGGGVDVASRREVLFVEQPYSNHNGGHLVFGPDGHLYIGLGDGGSAGDPQDRAQSLDTLLGKMLRIAPRAGGGQAYSVPQDNPFVGRGDARPEIWSFGLRNPWRYSFDRENGDLWIGDVGQDSREEIDLQAASSNGGENYGWDGYEGRLPYEEPLPKRAEPPVYDYGRDLGGTVVGGHVYRGSAIPDLRGAYVFGDFYNPDLRALVPEGRGVRHIELGVQVENLSSFGEDAAGELYALSLAGPVYLLAPAP
jgi:glucose/arabinose dehydrogenase